ncbi:molybdate ABC transporter substrate-binding protein [uncultured Pseudoalteromonas sp.]|uniref:molybdate ABC transporter substrate-binding protein n=1 Tax=uncultured Pseudoalteromonas sp. TaxID=114053 RepID=UPI0030C8AF12
MLKLYNTWCGYLLLLLVLFSNCISAKETLHIAVASNFKPVLQTLVASPALKNINFKISAASSGVLHSQIMHGAPYDIFLSADATRPQALINDGFAIKDSLTTYAIGLLALWQPSNSVINNKLAIANPRFSPYGQASAHYAKNYIKTPYEFVYANNITHAFQFVETGNAAKGLVALSTLKSAYGKTKNKKYLNYSLIDTKNYPEITQQGVIISTSKHLTTAKKFMDFLNDPSTAKTLLELGYKAKGSDVSK